MFSCIRNVREKSQVTRRKFGHARRQKRDVLVEQHPKLGRSLVLRQGYLRLPLATLGVLPALVTGI